MLFAYLFVSVIRNIENNNRDKKTSSLDTQSTIIVVFKGYYLQR
jgi:hypothetical protein